MLITIAALYAQLLGLRAVPAAVARAEMETIARRARHRLKAEGRDMLPSLYVLEHGLRTDDVIHDLIRRDERMGLRHRAAELLGLSLVAANVAGA